MSEILTKIVVNELGPNVDLIFRFEQHYLKMTFSPSKENIYEVALKLDILSRKLITLERDMLRYEIEQSQPDDGDDDEEDDDERAP